MHQNTRSLVAVLACLVSLSFALAQLEPSRQDHAAWQYYDKDGVFSFLYATPGTPRGLFQDFISQFYSTYNSTFGYFTGFFG